MSEKSINERFRMFREAIGAKRGEIAQLLGRTYQTVKDIEDGKSDIKVEHIQKLSEKYRLNPAWLISGEGPQLLDQAPLHTVTPFIAGRRELSELLEAIYAVLPEEHQNLGNLLKQAIHELMEENDRMKSRQAQMLEELNNLLRKL